METSTIFLTCGMDGGVGGGAGGAAALHCKLADMVREELREQLDDVVVIFNHFKTEFVGDDPRKRSLAVCLHGRDPSNYFVLLYKTDQVSIDLETYAEYAAHAYSPANGRFTCEFLLKFCNVAVGIANFRIVPQPVAKAGRVPTAEAASKENDKEEDFDWRKTFEEKWLRLDPAEILQAKIEAANKKNRSDEDKFLIKHFKDVAVITPR